MRPNRSLPVSLNEKPFADGSENQHPILEAESSIIINESLNLACTLCFSYSKALV